MHIRKMRLEEYMTAHGFDDSAMALIVQTDELKCDRSMISRYRRRVGRPDWPVIERIKVVTNGEVSADDFINLEAAE